MGRNRFQLLLRTIHFVDNEGVPEDGKTDKLWKIRPFLKMFREQCLLVTPEENQAVDEMMVPFKGQYSHIKQYIRGKPNPWEFKIWCRCSKSGILHDFEVYQGKTGTNRDKSALGVAGEVVSKLSDTLPSHKNYKLFADNLFTSVGLLEKLQQTGFQYTGTVRANRLHGCSLKSEKELSKLGRGTSDYRVEQDTNIICVRWHDTKAVTLMSTCVGTLPLDTAKRWDKAQKEYRDVSRPLIIKEYNSNMGGIDLLDSCVVRYKFQLKSRRWYMYLFLHFIHLAVVNGWFFYRRDCQMLGLEKPLILRRFQAQIATGLIQVNTTKKRGRPPLDRPESPTLQPKRVRIPPSRDARKDQFAHLPIKIDKRRRCAICQITTNTHCEKCNVSISFTENRNCFREYHV
ncbi:piggyBac transposable element-derived protein 3-like [Liolophura sinensis]|uniref:piggyBac transposable element-derived protein 3-like n=1 Tax=Liolophura sinensis TaxID=3198878 RepID=UPI00315820D0